MNSVWMSAQTTDALRNPSEEDTRWATWVPVRVSKGILIRAGVSGRRNRGQFLLFPSERSRHAPAKLVAL